MAVHRFSRVILPMDAGRARPIGLRAYGGVVDMALKHAYDRFVSARRDLESTRPIKARLYDAYTHISDLRQSMDLPADLHLRYLMICSSLSCDRPMSDDPIRSSVEAMPDERAEAIAEHIVSLADEVHRRYTTPPSVRRMARTGWAD